MSAIKCTKGALLEVKSVNISVRMRGLFSNVIYSSNYVLYEYSESRVT